MKVLLTQGNQLTDVLKTIIKQHYYGNGSDKLVEFGIQPFRARPKPTVVPPAPPEAGTPGPTPATTTTTTPTAAPPSTK